MLYSPRLMDRTVLPLLFASFFSLVAYAQNIETTIIPMDEDVEIWAFTPTGRNELPQMTIHNSTAGCDVDASQTGRAEALALTNFVDKRNAAKVAQVISAKFNNCRLFFGRVRIYGPNNKIPEFVLMNVIGIGKSSAQTIYNKTSLDEQLAILSRQLLKDPKATYFSSALVLRSFR